MSIEEGANYLSPVCVEFLILKGQTTGDGWEMEAGGR